MSANTWIILGILAGAFSLYAIPHGFHIKAQKKPETHGNQISDSNIGGDVVGRDKITQSITTILPKLEEEDREKKIKISKIKIKRIIEDLATSIETSKKKYLEENNRIAGDFNRRNVISSGVHIKAQMEYAVRSKEEIEKLFTVANRNIEDILLENFGKTSLSEMPEFTEENNLFEKEKNKLPSVYKLYENIVKSWERKSLNQAELTKDFKL